MYCFRQGVACFEDAQAAFVCFLEVLRGINLEQGGKGPTPAAALLSHVILVVNDAFVQSVSSTMHAMRLNVCLDAC